MRPPGTIAGCLRLIAVAQGDGMHLTEGTPRLLPTWTAIRRPAVGEVIETAVGTVQGKSVVMQFPASTRRAESVDLGPRELTQYGQSVRNGSIEEAIGVGSPCRYCPAGLRPLDDAQQRHRRHRIFVADALEPRGEGLIRFRSGAYRPRAGVHAHVGSIRRRSLTRSTPAASMNSLPS